jgi:hypothetical protein
MKKIIAILFLLNAGFGFGQFGVTTGATVLNNFGAGRNFYGFQFGGEYALSDENSYFGRISIYPGLRPKEMDSLYLMPKDAYQPAKVLYYTPKTSFVTLEGGSRYYLGDGYEYGFSAYGGYKFTLLLCNVQLEYEEFDNANYRFPDNFQEKGSLISLNAGLQAGIKYSIGTTGTVYLDGSIDYSILNQVSNNTVAISPYLNSPLFFSINLGFRKDLMWR